MSALASVGVNPNPNPNPNPFAATRQPQSGQQSAQPSAPRITFAKDDNKGPSASVHLHNGPEKGDEVSFAGKNGKNGKNGKKTSHKNSHGAGPSSSQPNRYAADPRATRPAPAAHPHRDHLAVQSRINAQRHQDNAYRITHDFPNIVGDGYDLVIQGLRVYASALLGFGSPDNQRYHVDRLANQIRDWNNPPSNNSSSQNNNTDRTHGR